MTMGRSENMRRIRAVNTRPEVALRRALYARGLRYRIHVRQLPGKPDIVFRSRKLVVLVHGCFWHQHPGCREASRPRLNSEYWLPKLMRNVERDKQHEIGLEALGFRVLILWECEIEKQPAKAVAAVLKLLEPS